MSSTVFTGPVIAGNILNTNGTTVAKAGGSVGLQNVGFCQMGQVSAAFTQAGTTSGTATTIVIPAQSIITDIWVYVPTAWSASATLSIGTSATATELATSVSMSQGQTTVNPGSLVAAWVNTASQTSDIQIFVKSSATGTGTGAKVVVGYMQGVNGFTFGTTNTNYTA